MDPRSSWPLLGSRGSMGSAFSLHVHEEASALWRGDGVRVTPVALHALSAAPTPPVPGLSLGHLQKNPKATGRRTDRAQLCSSEPGVRAALCRAAASSLLEWELMCFQESFRRPWTERPPQTFAE